MVKWQDLEKQLSHWISGILDIQADEELDVLKHAIKHKDINRAVSPSVEIDSFEMIMQKRLMNVKEVCSKYHETYDGR